MKKILLSLLLVFALVFSTTAVCFAAVGDEEIVQPYATSSINIGIDRVNGSTASTSTAANFATTVDSYTVTVYLQKLSNNNWINDTNNEDYVTRVTGSNRSSVAFNKLYDDLTYGTSYRLKVVSKTVVNGSTYTMSGYSKTF